MFKRRITREPKMCGDCREGNVVKKSQYHNYWLSLFTQAEIDEMARAIWG